MKKGWLVNDCLTCIPNTKTFWHDLLENVEGLEDKTFGYTEFSKLATKIETQLSHTRFWIQNPDYIIRNATFFRPIRTKVPQVCLLQDYYDQKYFFEHQLPVIQSCCTTVVNSPFVYDLVKNVVEDYKVSIIPMGVDFDFFNPNIYIEDDTINILPDSILFIGASTVYPKGFDLLMNFVENTKYNFTFVMKDNFKITHPRITVFNRIDQTKLKSIMKKCRIAICTSQIETFHLSGIECGAMNVPVATTNVGIYMGLPELSGWGRKFTKDNIFEVIKDLYDNAEKFSPRQTLLDLNLDKKACMNAWKNIINDL